MIITQSKEIRKLLMERIEKDNISIFHLCKYLDVDYKNFVEGYLLTTGKTRGIREKDVVKVAEFLGIKIRIQIVLLKAYDIKEIKNKIHGRRNTQEEGADSGLEQPDSTDGGNLWGHRKTRIVR